MDAEQKLDIAVSLLDKQGLIEYEQLITAAEQDCESNGFHDTPAEVEHTMRDKLRLCKMCGYYSYVYEKDNLCRWCRHGFGFGHSLVVK